MKPGAGPDSSSFSPPRLRNDSPVELRTTEAPKILFLPRQRIAFPSVVLLNNRYTGSRKGTSYAIDTSSDGIFKPIFRHQPPNGIYNPIPDIARPVPLHTSANLWAL